LIYLFLGCWEALHLGSLLVVWLP